MISLAHLFKPWFGHCEVGFSVMNNSSFMGKYPTWENDSSKFVILISNDHGIYMSRFWLICLQCLGIMDYNLENVVFL